MTNKLVVVIKEHKSPFPDPLILDCGDMVDIEPKETEWKGWVWCIDARRNKGWVPESYLKITGKKAILKKDYNATELNAAVGQHLYVLDKVASWYYCRTEENIEGWIPIENVKEVQ